MNKKLLRKKLALMLANLKKKRKYYCECEYLESTGTQYIDTGIIPSNNMEFRTKINFTSISGGDVSVIAARVGGSNRTQPIFCYANKWTVAIGNTYDSNGASVSTNTDYDIKSVITEGKTITLYANGSQVATLTNTGGIADVPFYIFARNYGTYVDAYSSLKMNYMKIYSGGILVRDFIPVLDWDMTPCMYDKVTEQLFYNQGTGDFVAGREIHPVEYIESTGTQYIDTGYVPTNTTGVQIKHTICADNGTDNIIFGCRQDSQNTRFWEDLDWGNDDSIGWGYGVYSNQDPTYSIYRYKLISSDIGKTVVSRLNYLNSRNCSIDDNIRNLPQTTLPTITRPIYIFAANNQGNAGYFTNFKVYEVQISEGSALVRDFIPAIDQNGTAFLFDRVSHTCYLNQGTGAFKYPAREVEYLESDGTQYIDTGVYPTQLTEAEYRCAVTGSVSNADSHLFGSRRSASSEAFDLAYMNTAPNGLEKFRFIHGTTTTQETTTSVTASQLANPHTYYMSGTSFKVDGSVKMSFTTTSFTGTYSLWLFGVNSAGSLHNQVRAQRVYKCPIWDNGVLVRDFIPCYKNGVACMVDKLTGTAYLNQGTGSFSVGRILESEYE